MEEIKKIKVGMDPEVMAGERFRIPKAFDDWCSHSQHQDISDISDISGHTTADHGTLWGFLNVFNVHGQSFFPIFP